MTTIDDSAAPGPVPAPTDAALADLAGYPFLSALTERRTRRIPRGFSVNAGPLSHESRNDPAPRPRISS